jgi:YD repeat-containing protein
VTSLERNEYYSYTSNGKLLTATDAEGNKTTYEYDSHDRLAKTRYPSPTKGSGVSSTTDYEQLTYETLLSGTRTSGLVTSRRNRAAETIGFTYDNLSRLTLKDLPGTEPDVSYGYDLLGRLLSANETNHQLSFTYDALGRQLTETSFRARSSTGLRRVVTFQCGTSLRPRSD